MKNYKFSMYSTVYHTTPDSDMGKIIEIREYASDGQVEYLVTTGFGQVFWCDEGELSETKVYK